MKDCSPTSRLETIDQLANAIGELELNDLTRDEVDGYFERIGRGDTDGCQRSGKEVPIAATI